MIYGNWFIALFLGKKMTLTTGWLLRYSQLRCLTSLFDGFLDAQMAVFLTARWCFSRISTCLLFLLNERFSGKSAHLRPFSKLLAPSLKLIQYNPLWTANTTASYEN